MSKYICRQIAIVALGLIWPLFANAQDLPEVIDHARPSVVTVIAFDKAGKPYSLGSGYVAREDGVVVTAWHVIDKAAFVKIKFTDGKMIQVLGTYAVDKVRDFALLKVDANHLAALPFGDASVLRQGTKVLALGSPLGLEFTASEGIISAFRKQSDGTNYLQITAPISHGNSGGPILDSKGNVVGIAVFNIKDGQSLNFALPSNVIASRLSQSTTMVLWNTANPSIKVSRIQRSVVVKSNHANKKSEAANLKHDIAQANSLYESGRWSEAYVLLKRIIAAGETHQINFIYLGHVCSQLGQHQESVNAFMRAALAPGENTSLAYYRIGDEYLRLGQVNNAKQVLDGYVELCPDKAVANYDAAELISYTSGNTEKWKASEKFSIDYLKAAIEIAPDRDDTRLNKKPHRIYDWMPDFKTSVLLKSMGERQMYLEMYDDAAQSFEKAIRLYPAQCEFYTSLGVAYVCLKRFAEAREILQKPLLQNLTLESSLQLGKAYRQAREDLFMYDQDQIPFRDLLLELELAAHKNSVHIRPESLPACWQLANYYLLASVEHWQEASDTCLQALALKRTKEDEDHFSQWMPDETEIYFGLGKALTRLGKKDEAWKKGYSIPLQMHLKNAFAQQIAGERYLENDLPNEAVIMLKKALITDPDNGSVLNRLGIAYVRLKDTEHALEQYKRLKALHSDYAERLFAEIYPK